jgi:UDP-N-acetylmuramoyl-L-alanyl-D-glutamate--2,6-diaminopimelate ligase
MRLQKLLDEIAVQGFQGDAEIDIIGLAYDSREIRPGYLFVALRGHTTDGHDFIGHAVQNGAVAVIAEVGKREKRSNTEFPTVWVSDTREALSKLAVRFYDRPFKDMNLVGITGTNGKTTTCYLLESILSASGSKPGVIGTINYRSPGCTWEATTTTPESLELMHTLRRMADAGVTDVLMEVSSHALDQGRTRDCPFRVAIFTNISRDHLDYHPSMEAYFEAKSRLFLGLRERGAGDFTRAVINMDDRRGEELARLTDVPIVTYGLGKDCDVRADPVQVTKTGVTARLITPTGEMDIRSPLIGGFNIYNILAAAAGALCLGVDLYAVALGIERLSGVPGRLERVENARLLNVVVDYAHTPDALLKALDAVKPMVEGRLITVFGCGGDRDAGKRKAMGRVAGEYSDVVFITSDNPRTEDPAAIARQIEEGVRESGMERLADSPENRLAGPGYILDLDRGSAITRAVQMADQMDLILIAGKGHEDYQIIGKEKRHFDDRTVAAEAVMRGL